MDQALKTVESSMEKAELPGTFGERDHLISTAVKFLHNPRVRDTSLHQKLQFLRQKGLNEPEINAACDRAGIDMSFEQKPLGSLPLPSMQLATYNPTVTVWSKAKDMANLVALFSIGSFSLYYLWQQFLAPKLFGVRSRREENYDKLLLSITKLNENVTELKDLIRNIQETQTLQKQLEITSSKSKTSQELRDIKGELCAIKSLLLGRAQFPTSPSVSSGIPSWQMLEAEGDDDTNGKDVSKSKRKERKGQRKQEKTSTEAGNDETEPEAFVEMAASSSSTVAIHRKHPSGEGDSNNGFTSGSSCEVVYPGGKHDSNSETNSE